MARILVVDDEPSVRKLLWRLLSLHQHVVDTAADGDEAIEKLQKQRYDVMIIDRNMPNLSGVEAVSMVRTSSRYKDLKILMVTCASSTKEIDEAYTSGVNGYIVKPFDIQRMLEKVERALLSNDRRP